MTTKRVKAPTIAEVRGMVEQHWADWCESNGTEQAIRDRVHRMLDKGTQEIVCKLLGFEKDAWNGWRIDHCNGRSGNSAVGDYLREKVGNAVTAWIDQQAELPELPKTSLAEVRKAYLSMYNTALRRRLAALAADRAERKAIEMLAALEAEATGCAGTDQEVG